MKNWLFGILVVILIFGLVFFGCKSKNTLEESYEKTSESVVVIPAFVNNQEITLPVTVSNHSFLTEENVGEAFSIVGELQQVENKWLLIENPKSKSKVTFVLEGFSSMENLLAENLEKSVKITGVLTAVDGAWSKTLSVSAIEVLKQ